MRTCNTLFKSTCDACSKSKTKCDGANPCAVCTNKRIECKYAFRMKRGPKGSGADDRGGKKNAKATPRVMSSFERRLWSVFFTVFKNTRPTAESQFVWCWYASQLNKLSQYFALSGNERLISLLDQFYKCLDIEQNQLRKRVVKVCPFSPHVCGECSSMTILPPESPILVKYRKAEPEWDSSAFSREFASNEKPCLVFFAGEGKELGFSVNTKFVQKFKYEAPHLNKLLHWSNGGFLPFGGDLFAALFVYESDVLLFLQIMSFKYQAARLPKSQAENKIYSKWKVPSCHCFKCWCVYNPKIGLEICDVSFQLVINIEKRDSQHLATRMELVVQSIERAKHVEDSNLKPVSHEFPLVDVKPPVSLSKSPQVLPCALATPSQKKTTENTQVKAKDDESSEQMCDTSYNCDALPEDYESAFNSWVQVPESLQPPKSSDSLEYIKDDDPQEFLGDNDWFQTLSEWAMSEDKA